MEKNGGLQSCLRCGNMFLYSGVGKCICENCKKEDEEEFQSVKNYIYDHPLATIMEISKETGVRVTRIKSYLRDGRLIISDDSPIFINCEICGESIKYGRLCRSCADTMSNEMRNALKVEEYQVGEKPNPASRTRFLEH